jgi:Domain of unknown function (DUF4440)
MSMNRNQELTEIERTLWRNDAEIYGRTFLPDALLIFSEVGRIDLESALNAIRGENAAGHHWAEVIFADVRSLTILEDVALLSYVATARWNYKEDVEKVLCTTLYVKRDGAWRVAVHQQTPVAVPLRQLNDLQEVSRLDRE